jgi:lysophospholipase L1-like esterase
MPIWALVATATVIAVLAAVAFVNMPSAVQAEPQRTPRTDFSFGAPQDERPHARWLGDSFTEAGQVPENERFPKIVSEHFGWTLTNAAEGGTGYVTDGPQEFPEREPLTGHVQRVIADAPDFLFVAAGLNDTSRNYTEDEIRAAVQETLGGVRDGLPETEIVVIGPFWPRGNPIPEILMVRDIVREEAEARGLRFLDPIEGEWVNRDPALIGPDGTHPTSAGQAVIAQRIIESLTAAGVSPYEATPAA